MDDSIGVTSSSFSAGEPIPDRFTAYHEGVSPALSWSSLPPGTKSVFLYVDDPDAPRAKPFVHWLVANLRPEQMIEEGRVPDGAIQGTNDRDLLGYFGPRPPSGVHHYRFHVIALDGPLDLPSGFRLEDARRAMEGHVLGTGELVGTYDAPPRT